MLTHTHIGDVYFFENKQTFYKPFNYKVYKDNKFICQRKIYLKNNVEFEALLSKWNAEGDQFGWNYERMLNVSS